MKKIQEPLFDNLTELDQQINIHLIDVNSRNGWNLEDQDPMAGIDKWFPWVLAIGTGISIAIIKLVF